MKNLSDLLGDLGKEFPDAIEGKNPASGYDGPPLPETQQYRAEIVRGEWRQSTTSGKYSFAFTFEITEPAEFAGRKFSEYYDPDGHAVGREKLSRLIGESGLNMAEVDQTSYDNFASAFEGTKYVLATRIWGTDNDRTGLRYLNKDRGQTLQTNIKPVQKRSGGSTGLKADISVLKEQSAETPEEVQGKLEGLATPPTTLPGGNRPPVNLPQGLRRT